LPLADGSEVVLNANSQVTLDITPDHRRVRLDRGQAQFNVSKNERVPFEVPVDSTVVEALGTVFTVKKGALGDSEVVVVEGRVLIHAQERDPGFPLGEGQTADVEQGHVQMRPKEISQLDARNSWTAGVVELRSTKLSEAAERFNPHNRRQLVVDPDIADMHVDGIFVASDPEGFAASLEQLRGIHRSFSRDPETGVEIIRLSKQALPSGSSNMTGDGKRLADPH
jgi:transmembrane sensor